MTLAEARRAWKKLNSVHTDIAGKHGASTTIQKIMEAQNELTKLMTREVCPSCKELLGTWSDHKSDCKAA